MEQHFEMVLHRGVSLAVEVGAEDVLGTCHHEPVGAPLAFAAGACRTDEVVVSIAVVDVGALGVGAGNLHFLGSLAHTQPVVGELDAVDSAETAPEEVLAAVVFDVEGVDAVLYAYLVADEQLAYVSEGTLGLLGRGHSDAAFPFASPLGLGVVEDVAVADAVDVRSPEPSAFAPRLPVRRHAIAYCLPCHHVLGTINRQVCLLVRCGIGVEVTSASPVIEDCRIRAVMANHRIGKRS